MIYLLAKSESMSRYAWQPCSLTELQQYTEGHSLFANFSSATHHNLWATPDPHRATPPILAWPDRSPAQVRRPLFFHLQSDSLDWFQEKTGEGLRQLLVGGLNPSEKYWSIGMIIPNIWENKKWQPNHQPGYFVSSNGSNNQWEIALSPIFAGQIYGFPVKMFPTKPTIFVECMVVSSNKNMMPKNHPTRVIYDWETNCFVWHVNLRFLMFLL